ncbi:MAG: acetyl/propionyl/methylcrotonyl-CoA carboxylase subunit alpha [Promethearchaeota archaeon]
MFQKVLVANRGEVAVRILEACQEMEITGVSIFSDVDVESRHVEIADESYPLGEPTPTESYLNMDKIIKIAKAASVEAIHPGYGFLSENAIFARRCIDADITFIGPPPEVIALMGDKVAARKRMIEAKVPVIPGYNGGSQSYSYLKKQAKELGYPVILKASGGGGGKGMRLVNIEKDFKSAYEAARREAKAAFGVPDIYLEKYINNPRHIEIQILADKLGNVIHLFERECSIQRRYQKIIEETPSPFIERRPDLREKMGEAAVNAAQAVGYNNAGTVEFVVGNDGSFYFLEMNTRLQVEHAITEATTGIDLVKWQIKIAAGQPLTPLTLLDNTISQYGHALEVRIYAEDPQNDFLPCVGTVLEVHFPESPGVRHDAGFQAGDKISTYYDPMLAKLIVHSESRADSIRKMAVALSNYAALGITTNVEFLREVLAHPAFKRGWTTTHFIKNYFSNWTPVQDEAPIEALLAAAVYEAMETGLGLEMNNGNNGYSDSDPFSPWKYAGKWRVGVKRILSKFPKT